MSIPFLAFVTLCAGALCGYEDFSTIQEARPTVMMSVAVNIEGKIVEVSPDGKSFKLDNGIWVRVTKETILGIEGIGIEGPTAPPKEKQYFEPTFRVGNSIAGFSENPHAKVVIAYAIYTNWNWENPPTRAAERHAQGL